MKSRVPVYTMCYFFFIIAVVLLWGCSGKVVQLSFDQKSDNGAKNSIDIRANGAAITTETTQRAESGIGYQGGIGGTGGLKDAIGNFNPDLSQKNSNNQEEKIIPEEAEKPEPVVEKPPAVTEPPKVEDPVKPVVPAKVE